MFGKMFRRRNIMEDANKTYLQSCHYNKASDPFCPVFRIGDIVTSAGENFTQLAVRGGVVVISIEWNCNLDWDFLEFCKPDYSFRRADDPNTNIAPGWNFRYSNAFRLYIYQNLDYQLFFLGFEQICKLP